MPLYSNDKSKSEIINGHSHSFDTGIACELGVNAAIVYNHILYWLKHNKIKNQNFYDDHTWMYETIEKISEFFEYLTIRQVRLALKLLVDSGLLIEGNFNLNKFDRTTWYSVSDEEILNSKRKYEAPLKAHDALNSALPKDIQGACVNINIQDKYQENNISTQPSAKHISFGSFVKMSKEDYEKLIDKFGKTSVDDMIEQMNDWIPNKRPKGYTDYPAALRLWFKRKETQQGSTNAIPFNKVDRRTKKTDGSPVKSPAEGLF